MLDKFPLLSKEVVEKALYWGLSSAGVLVAFLTYLSYYEEEIIFRPTAPLGNRDSERNPRRFRSPEEYGMEYANVRIPVGLHDSLQLWFIGRKTFNEAPTFIYFQGNAGNSGMRLPFFAALHNIMHANIVAVSYRGYGKSTGKPSEKNMYEDAAAALKFVLEEAGVDKSKIYLFGSSIGCTVALRACLDHQADVRGLILESPFTSILDTATHNLPVLKPLTLILRYLMRVKMNNLKVINKVTVPTLFIVAEKDSIVPCHHGEKLYKHCSSPLKRFTVIKNADHNDVTDPSHGPEFLKSISAFLADTHDSKWAPAALKH